MLFSYCLRNFSQEFTRQIPQAVDYAVIRMVHVLLLEFLTGTYEISGGAMRGMGYSLVPALLTVVGCCGFRVAWLYTVFKICPTFSMLMNVYPATWVITGTLVMGAYLIIRKGFRINNLLKKDFYC